MLSMTNLLLGIWLYSSRLSAVHAFSPVRVCVFAPIMLVCLACPKQNHLPPADAAPEDDDDPLAISKPRHPSRDHVKSFTTQLKDIVMKFSAGAYRHCRPCNARNSHDQDDEKTRSIDLYNFASSGELSPNDGCHLEESAPSRYDLLPTSNRRRNRSRNCSGAEIFLDDISKFSARIRIRESADHDNGACGDQSAQSCGDETVMKTGNDDEWVAQVEPGVMITFVALPDGHNYLKRIRFSRELFGKWRAQLWWTENCDIVHELYSVTRCEAACDSPGSSTSSSIHEDALRNTPEILSRAASRDRSPPDDFISDYAAADGSVSPEGASLSGENVVGANDSLETAAQEVWERSEGWGDEGETGCGRTSSCGLTGDETDRNGEQETNGEVRELKRVRLHSQTLPP